MLPTLTDGKTTLEPDLFEFRSSGVDHDELRLETQLLFGPLRQRLAPGKGVLWWGSFSLADRLGMTVYACQGACLRLRILDLEYRVLEQLTSADNPGRLLTSVQRTGLVFFHVVNEGERDELVFLQMTQRHDGSFAPAPPLRSRGQRWLLRLEFLLGMRGGPGRRLDADPAR